MGLKIFQRLGLWDFKRLGHRNRVLSEMYTEWIETDEGKAWAQKKAEKKAKQKEIQAKIRTAFGPTQISMILDHGLGKQLYKTGL